MFLGAVGFGSDDCHYCQQSGHWKNECPALRGRGGGSANVRPTALAAQAPGCSKGVRDPGVLGSCTSGRGEYLPFITDGFFSLVGGGVQVLVKILRDTGASETFVLQSVLPFSPVSDTGTRILVCGIGLNTFAVPLHRLVL